MEITRRQFCMGLGGLAALPLFPFTGEAIAKTIKGESNMPFTLPPLPYDKSALEPHMSAKTFEFHHGKHHQAYVTKLNELIAGTELEGKSLEDIILATADKADKAPIFNNAAQVWNHTFFWNSMTPKNGGGKPTGELAAKIESDLGGFDKFAADFQAAGIGQFGSGWAWLVQGKDGKLKIVKTPNAETPFTKGDIPLLTADVWEHAYYLDYQNKRPDFLKTFIEKLANWDFAAQNLSRGSVYKAA